MPEDQILEHEGRAWRELNARPEMSGGDIQVIPPRHAAEIGQAVRTAWPQTSPAAFQMCVGQVGHERPGQGEQFADRRGRGVLAETGILLGRAHQDMTVGTRHEIARPPQQNATHERRRRLEQGDLPAHGTDAQLPPELLQQGIGPGARGHEEALGPKLAGAGLDGRDSPAAALEAMRGATAAKLDAQSGAARRQRLEVARVTDLGHVRQINRRAQAGRQRRFDLRRLAFVQGLGDNAFPTPFLLRGVAALAGELQPAAAPVAVVDAGPLAQLGRQRGKQRDAVRP